MVNLWCKVQGEGEIQFFVYVNHSINGYNNTSANILWSVTRHVHIIVLNTDTQTQTFVLL